MAAYVEALGDERALILACQAGEEAALSSFYERYFSQVHRFVLASVGSREDAEDITAEVFMRALRGIERFEDRERGVLPWLFRIVRNEIATHYRRKSRRIAPDSLETQQNGQLGRYDSSETVDRVMDLATSLRQLPRAQRDAVTLRFAAGLSTREAAQAMGMPEGTVRSHLHFGIKALRKAMGA